MDTQMYTLSKKRHRELFSQLAGNRLVSTMLITALAVYLHLKSGLESPALFIFAIAVGIGWASACKGLYRYYRRDRRYRFVALMDKDQLVLTYPKLERLVLNFHELKRISLDGKLLHFRLHDVPVDGLFARRKSPFSDAVLSWIRSQPNGEELLRRAVYAQEKSVQHAGSGLFKSIPRFRVHVYAQVFPGLFIAYSLLLKFMDPYNSEYDLMVSASLMLSILILLVVESFWKRSVRKAKAMRESTPEQG